MLLYFDLPMVLFKYKTSNKKDILKYMIQYELLLLDKNQNANNKAILQNLGKTFFLFSIPFQ